MKKNFLSLLGSNFTVQILRFITIALLARRLGKNIFGAYNYIILLVSYGNILVEFGLKNYAIREFSQNRGSSTLIKKIFVVRGLLAIFGGAIVVVFTHTAFNSWIYFWPSLYFGVSLFIDAFLVDFVIISNEKISTLALGQFIQAFFVYIVSLFFIKSDGDFILFSQVFLVSHVLWVIFFLFNMGPVNQTRSGFSFEKIFQIAQSGFPFLIAQLLATMLFSMDMLLLGQFHYEEWLGDYSVALKILGVPLGIVFALMGAVQPKLAKHSHDFTKPELRDLMFNVTRVIWVFIWPMILGCWFFGEELVHLIFGAQFTLSAALLKPLSLAFALFCLASAPLHTLFVSEKTKKMLLIVIGNFLLSSIVIGAILFLGYPQWVAWGMVLAQCSYLFGAWSLFQFKGLFSREDMRVLIAGMILLCPLLLKQHLPALASIALAGVAYTLGLVFLRVLSRPWFKAIF